MNRIRSSVLFLATLSGVCGISYELLYSRILSSYFGDMYYITAAILMGFLASLGVGALVAHRFVRYLPHIEIGIGLYAFLAAYVFNTHMELLVRGALQVGNLSEPFMLTLVAILLLVVPAFLIGFSVPIFAHYFDATRAHGEDGKSDKDGFRHVYLLYNVGAALAVLLIEFYLIQSFGITSAMLAIGSLNVAVGFALFVVRSRLFAECSTFAKEEMSGERGAGYVEPVANASKGRASYALFLLSVASGIFQLFYLELTYRVFGPFNENLAIMLATVFLGLSFGTYLVSRLKISLRTNTAALTAALAVTAVLVTPLIYLSAYAMETLGIPHDLTLHVKVVLVTFFGIAAFTCFGMTVPAFLLGTPKVGEGQGRARAGRALALSAFGNAIGFFLTVFVLHYHFDTPHVLLAAFLILCIAYTLTLKEGVMVHRREQGAVMTFAAVCFTAALFFWPHLFLRVGYDRLHSLEQLRAVQYEVVGSTDFRHFGDYVSVLDLRDGRRMLVYNGYFSLDLSQSGSAVAFRETLVGVHGAMFSEQRERALVLGLGTGITAGASAEVYSEVDVAEINPAMLDVTEVFRSYNFNLPLKENVDVVIQDGIVELINTEKTYDAIINTVASPAYFSASKLWTVEALELVKERLRPGGVYVSWLDSRAGVDGVQTQIKTLTHVFPQCRYMLLNAQYHTVVCGAKLEPAADAEIVWSERLELLMKGRGVTQSVESFLRDLDVTPGESENSQFSKNFEDYQLNTMNKPTLEFLGSAYRYLEDSRTADFFSSFTTLPEGVDGVTLMRRCIHLDLMVSDRVIFLEQFPECVPVFQTN